MTKEEAIAQLAKANEEKRKARAATESTTLQELTMDVPKDAQICSISRYSVRKKRRYTALLINGRLVAGGGALHDRLLKAFNGYAPDAMTAEEITNPTVIGAIHGENADEIDYVIYAKSAFSVENGEVNFEAEVGTASKRKPTDAEAKTYAKLKKAVDKADDGEEKAEAQAELEAFTSKLSEVNFA